MYQQIVKWLYGKALRIAAYLFFEEGALTYSVEEDDWYMMNSKRDNVSSNSSRMVIINLN